MSSKTCKSIFGDNCVLANGHDGPHQHATIFHQPRFSTQDVHFFQDTTRKEERARIRRAQADALRSLRYYLTDDPMIGVLNIIDAATRAPRKARKK